MDKVILNKKKTVTYDQTDHVRNVDMPSNDSTSDETIRVMEHYEESEYEEIVAKHELQEEVDSELSDAEMKNFMELAQQKGITFDAMDANDRKGSPSLRTYLAISEIEIAKIFNDNNVAFLANDKLNKFVITPIELKSIFYVLFVNRLFDIGALVGDYGDFPRVSAEFDIPIPVSIANFLARMGTLKTETGCTGTLQFVAPGNPIIESNNIRRDEYDPTVLNSVAYTPYQGASSDFNGLMMLTKDLTYNEAVVDTQSPLATTAYDLYNQMALDGHLAAIISYLSENYKTVGYSKLIVDPKDGGSERPLELFCERFNDRNVISPYSGFDPYYGTIFNFYDITNKLLTPHIEALALPGNIPEPQSNGISVPPDYVLQEYVFVCHYRSEYMSSILLSGEVPSSEKLWTLNGVRVESKKPTYKLFNNGLTQYEEFEELVNILDQVQNANDDLENQSNISDVKFIRTSMLTLATQLIHQIRSSSPCCTDNVSFLSTPPSTKGLTTALGHASILQRIGAIGLRTQKGGELVVPFMNLVQMRSFYQMVTDVVATESNEFYANPMRITGDADTSVNVVQFGDQQIDSAWVAGYSAIGGSTVKRPVPLYALASNSLLTILKSTFKAASALTSYNKVFSREGGQEMFCFWEVNQSETELLVPTFRDQSPDNKIYYRPKVPTYVGCTAPIVEAKKKEVITLALTEDSSTGDSDTENFSRNLCRGAIIPGQLGGLSSFARTTSEFYVENGTFTRNVSGIQDRHQKVQMINGIEFDQSNEEDCNLGAALIGFIGNTVDTGFTVLDNLQDAKPGSRKEISKSLVKTFKSAVDIKEGIQDLLSPGSMDKKLKAADREIKMDRKRMLENRRKTESRMDYSKIPTLDSSNRLVKPKAPQPKKQQPKSVGTVPKAKASVNARKPRGKKQKQSIVFPTPPEGYKYIKKTPSKRVSERSTSNKK